MIIKKETWLALAVFIFIAAILIIIESGSGFPDPDSFYHAKMAMTIRDQGFLKTFPWFQWTDLKNTYVNPHLLYHILLIPFVTLFHPLAGMKISAVIFGLTAFLAIYLSLRAFRVPLPSIFLFLSTLSFGLLHRVSLPRAPALSIALLLLATWAMLKRRTWILFFTAVIFVWFYHGWPIVLLSLGAVSVANMIARRLTEPKKVWRDFLDNFWQERKNWLATIGGLVFGLVVNPYFPQNIAFSVLDIFKIGVVNYQSVIAVGNEWLPKTPLDFITATSLVFCAFLLMLFLFVPGIKLTQKKPGQTEMATLFALIILTGGYSALCFKSSRYIEYTVPFMILATGILAIYIQPFWQKEFWPFFKTKLTNSLSKKIFGLFLLIIILGSLTFKQVYSIAKGGNKFQVEQFTTASLWIKEHVPTEKIIFHNSWDFSLILWYLDDQHYYLVGLDPTFMYDYDPEAYNLWWNLVTGEDPEVKKIIEVFDSRTVIIDTYQKSSETFMTNLKNSGLFTQVVDEPRVKLFSAVE